VSLISGWKRQECGPTTVSDLVLSLVRLVIFIFISIKKNIHILFIFIKFFFIRILFLVVKNFK
jgi:hypothetical protein